MSDLTIESEYEDLDHEVGNALAPNVKREIHTDLARSFDILAAIDDDAPLIVEMCAHLVVRRRSRRDTPR